MLDIVRTNYGLLKAVKSNKGFALFRGIPYGKAERWKAPTEPDKWEGIKVADTYGPACMQFDRWKDAIDDVTDDSGHPYIKIENYPYPPKMSEDCLYLNIYSPAENENDRLPICFYIHGGGLQQWYGNDYEYCGDQFCQEGCIVVTINYRLNVFGYFAHPDLAKENIHHSSGNYGLLDQIQALKWVYENIEFFGGDKNRIMIFGQSAGGGSCQALLASPLANNMIARASLQSCGGISSIMADDSKNEIEEKGVKFMKACGCRSIEEMRKLPAEYLRDMNDKVFGFGGFGINIDGYVLPKSFTNEVLDGTIKDVELIAGCTIDEGGNDKKPMFGFDCCKSVSELCKQQLIHHKKPIYSYVFARKQPGDDVGVPHSCDNRYQFGSLDGNWRPYEKADYDLSKKMTKYWANFAKTGNPNSDELEMWLPISETNYKSLKFDINKLEMTDFNK